MLVFRLLLLLLSACAHLPADDSSFQQDSAYAAKDAVSQGSKIVEPASVVLADTGAAKRLFPVDVALADVKQGDSATFYRKSLVYIEQPLVRKWIRYFTVKEAKRFQRFLNRGEYYRHYLQEQLRKHGLPEELYYLAMIESGFRNSARSKAHAVGIWQFMRRTGRYHGLLIDNFIDERMDVVSATSAAISYLQDLHRVYQSWWLAIASYNSGEVRILRAVMRRNTRDFFELVERKVLPKETINYVPKFIAAMHIAKNYMDFGFTIDASRTFSVDNFNIYRVPAQTYLSEVAKAIGCSSKLIKTHNPYIRHALVHPSKKIAVRLPSACRAVSVAQHNAFVKQSKRRFLAHQRQEIKGKYKVRHGDSLYAIARRFKTSIRSLRLANNLVSSRIYAGQLLRITSKALKNNHRVSSADKNTNQQQQGEQNVIRHRVRRGESLYRIAKKYKTSVNHLKRTNNLEKPFIYPGQIITISYL